jgi:prepilin signal peptidase PulO-like enzyme (type II secretory pathway)
MGARVAGVCVLVWLAALSFYDIRERRLPNWLTMPGAAMVLGIAAAHGRATPAMFGAVTLFVVYALVRTTPKFETADERYAWLSEVVALGYNILSPNHIDYRIYQVL